MIKQCPKCGYKLRHALVRGSTELDTEMLICLECGYEQLYDQDKGED